MKLKSVLSLLVIIILLSTAFGYAYDSVRHKKTDPYSGPMDIMVYRSPACECCSKWIEHLHEHQFNVTDIKTHDMEFVKSKYNVPAEMTSCHTAIIGGYIIEGHVPADDIKRLLKVKPDIAGLSVPGMPVGTPGMEMGDKKDPFAVITFDTNGKYEIFNEYWHY